MIRLIFILFCVCLKTFTNGQSLISQVDSTSNSVSSGAIAIVDHGSFNQGIIHTPFQLICGRITGLGMSVAGNDPNGEFMFRVRGLSTLQNDTRPLFIVDGLITPDLLTVDPADISQISLLKDAATASIYGLQGGNGVLLITTKRGNNKPATVSYSSFVGFDRRTGKIEPVSASEYKRFAGSNDLGSDQDWIDLISQNGASTIHNLALSKSDRFFSVRGSVNYRSAEGTLIGTGFNQLNTRLNLQHRSLNDRLLLQVNFSSTSRKSDFGFREAIKYAYNANPTMPVYDPLAVDYGGYRQTLIFDNYNPVAIIEQNENSGKAKSTAFGINGSYRFDAILPGLQLDLSYHRLDDEVLQGSYYNKKSFYVGASRNGLARRTLAEGSTNQLQSTLAYSKSVSDLDVQISSGYHFQHFATSSFYAEGGNFLTDAYGFNNMAAAGDFQDGRGTVSSMADSYEVLSWINSTSFVYRKKYFLNATATYSGSTRLGENNKWGLFPSVGGGILWDELPLFNSLKARASWGKSGNIPQSSNLSRSLITTRDYSLQNGIYMPFYITSRDANPDLQWEVKTEFNIGADFKLLNNRISGSIDFFKNRVSHLISPVVIPSPPNVSNSMIANIGELKNRGLEVNLNISAKRTTNLIWDVNLNVSHVKTKVVSLSAEGYSLISDGSLNIGTLPDAGGCSSHGVNLIQEGEALGQIQGPIFKAVVDGLPTHQDLNGDGYYCDCSDDFTVLGNALPNLTFGVGNRIAYRNLEVSFLLRGALGHHKINSFRIYQEAVGSVSYSNLVETSYFDPALQYTHLSSRYVENAGFLRLENITLKYNVPTPLKITISATIQNLFTITKYTGLDPDVAYGSPVVPGQTTYPINQSPLVSGLDSRGNYFTARTFSLGIGLSI